MRQTSRQIIQSLLVAVLATVAHAGSLPLQIEASPTPGVTYVLYGTTNATLVETNLSQAQVIIDAGTNLNVTVYTTPAVIGTWRWAATSKIGSFQSAPCGVLVTPVPAPPAGIVTLILDYSGTLEGIGTGPTNLFVRVKPGLP